MEHTNRISNLRFAILTEQKLVDFLDAVCKRESGHNVVADFMQAHATRLFIKSTAHSRPRSRRLNMVHRPKKEGEAPSWSLRIGLWLVQRNRIIQEDIWGERFVVTTSAKWDVKDQSWEKQSQNTVRPKVTWVELRSTRRRALMESVHCTLEDANNFQAGLHLLEQPEISCSRAETGVESLFTWFELVAPSWSTRRQRLFTFHHGTCLLRRTQWLVNSRKGVFESHPRWLQNSLSRAVAILSKSALQSQSWQAAHETFPVPSRSSLAEPLPFPSSHLSEYAQASKTVNKTENDLALAILLKQNVTIIFPCQRCLQRLYLSRSDGENTEAHQMVDPRGVLSMSTWALSSKISTNISGVSVSCLLFDWPSQASLPPFVPAPLNETRDTVSAKLDIIAGAEDSVHWNEQDDVEKRCAKEVPMAMNRQLTGITWWLWEAYYVTKYLSKEAETIPVDAGIFLHIQSPPKSPVWLQQGPRWLSFG
jgi:hypothetical protein